MKQEFMLKEGLLYAGILVVSAGLQVESWYGVALTALGLVALVARSYLKTKSK